MRQGPFSKAHDEDRLGVNSYDELGRRKSVVNGGTQFGPAKLNLWGYNPKSELLSSRRHEGGNPDSPGTEITGEKRLYNYDQIGNRLESTEGTGTATTYGANDVNRYDWVQPPSDPREYLCYDEDGNLKRDGKLSPDCPGADGKYEYKWDAENRLIEVVPVSSSIDPPRNKKVKFVYDYMGRRVRKDVFIYTGAWPADDNPNERWHFVYDGWNVVMVLDGLPGHNNAITRKYTWGLDFSQSIHGAAGIGGLLAVDETQGTYQGTYWFFYDANGNVGQLVKTIKDVNGNITGVESTLAAHYEYDPYGNVINSTGAYKDVNPFKFSTKWFDPETHLGYWGHRYYSPPLGRWISRDPIQEEGGLNLHVIVGNNPLNAYDPDGRTTSQPAGGAPRPYELGEPHNVTTAKVTSFTDCGTLWAGVPRSSILQADADPACTCISKAYEIVSATDADWREIVARYYDVWPLHWWVRGPYFLGPPDPYRNVRGVLQKKLSRMKSRCKNGFSFECECTDRLGMCDGSAYMYVWGPGGSIHVCPDYFVSRGEVLRLTPPYSAVIHELSHLEGTVDDGWTFGEDETEYPNSIYLNAYDLTKTVVSLCEAYERIKSFTTPHPPTYPRP